MSGLVDQNRPVAFGRIHGSDGGRGYDFDVGSAHGLKESGEEIRPVNSNAMEVATKLSVGDIEDLPPRGEGRSVEPVDAGAGGDDLSEQAETAEDAQPGRLEKQAGAHRPRGLETLEDTDTMSGTSKKESRRHAGRAAADDGDVGGRHHRGAA